LLDREVHYHANCGPRGYRCITFEIVDASDLFVAAHAEPSLVLALSAIGIPLDLEGPSRWQQVCSCWHRCLSNDSPSPMGLELGDFFSHCGEKLVAMLAAHGFMQPGRIRVVGRGGLHSMRSHHEGVGTKVFVQTKVVIQEEVEEIAIVVGLALSKKEGPYHGSTVGLDDGEPVLSIPLRSQVGSMRITTDGGGRSRCSSVIKVREEVNGRWRRPLRRRRRPLRRCRRRPLRRCRRRPLRRCRQHHRRRPLRRPLRLDRIVLRDDDMRIDRRRCSILRALGLVALLLVGKLNRCEPFIGQRGNKILVIVVGFETVESK
jgi:hypothetical protein